jgi:hypothetical protein
VPAQQGLGGDEKAPPPPSREQPTERREDRSVLRSAVHAVVELPFEQADLVAEVKGAKTTTTSGNARERRLCKSTVQPASR